MPAPRRLADRLNGVLTKGQNRLCKLVRFRRGQMAITAGILMAYNGTKLRPEHLKNQKYLLKTTSWRSCSPLKPGQVCGGCHSVGEWHLRGWHHQQPRCPQQDCMVVVDEIIKKIARESMSVKAFTFTGTTSQTRKCTLTGPMSDWPANYDLLKPTTRSVDQSSHGCVRPPRTCHTHGGRWSSRSHRIPALYSV